MTSHNLPRFSGIYWNKNRRSGLRLDMETKNVFHLRDEFAGFFPVFWNKLENKGKSGMSRVTIYSNFKMNEHNLARFQNSVKN